MQDYVVNLTTEIPVSFRTQKAANSLDIDVAKKCQHNFEIKADLATDYNIGIIVGSSGSGKTTLAKMIFGEEAFKDIIDLGKPIIDQLPEEMDYDECSQALNGIGLTAVPCWIKPAYTLSNGQRFRAEAVLKMINCIEGQTSIIDEWTSVVDRNAAKVMSHCVQKYARRNKKTIVLCSCHYDVIEWLNPDWIIDCNKQTYEDRRSMVGTFKRTDQLRLDIREVGSETWKYFSKYHYLSSNLPGGKNYFFGLFLGQEQIGFQCYSAYVPGKPHIMYSNRVVIHPDYAGFGLGIRFINETAEYMKNKNFIVKAVFSSLPLYKSRKNDPKWRLTQIKKTIKQQKVRLNGNFARLKSREKADKFRTKVKVFVFEYVGP